MKKLIALSLALALLLTCVAVTAVADQTAYIVSSNGKSVNVRRAPITHTDNVLIKLPYGTAVTVRNYEADGVWAYVWYAYGTTSGGGYVQRRYLTFSYPGTYVGPTSGGSSSSSSSSTGSGLSCFNSMKSVTPYNVVVVPAKASGYVNQRWAPSKESAVQQKCYSGHALIVIAEGGGWAQVYDTANNKVGFILKTFLQVGN